MIAEQFYQILDQLTKWKLGTFPGSAGSTGRPPKDENAAPECPYPVVTAFVETHAQCEWCDSICIDKKTYSKVINEVGQWKGSCGDCGQRRVVTTGQMIKFNRFTIAKIEETKYNSNSK